MAGSLFLSGRWCGAGVVAMPANSLVVLFSMQAACVRPPLPVVIVAVAGPTHTASCDNARGPDRGVPQQNACSQSKLNSECNGSGNDVSLESCCKLTITETINSKEIGCNINDSIVEQSDQRNEGEVSGDEVLFPVSVQSLSFPVSVVCADECPPMVRSAVLPAVYCHDARYCVVGMCAALRYMLLAAHDLHADVTAKKLLGFRDGCLHSCSEVSCWTKFCEVEMPAALRHVYSHSPEEPPSQKWTFPKTVLRYNNHLSRPPILHNALKRKQEHIKKTVKDKKQRDLLLSKKLHELPELDHDFAEGLDMTLADVMLFVCFDLIICKLSFLDFDKISPLVLKWIQLIKSFDSIKRALPMLDIVKSNVCSSTTFCGSVVMPEIIEESLYKSDPERPKLHCVGSMTLQSDIDRVVSRLAAVEVDYHHEDYESLPWSSYPAAVHPQEGELPPSRLLRKCQQLDNLVRVVMQHASPGDRIVDFCSGGGHVGIVLAYCLPQCTVALVENKASSLNRAKVRVEALALKNVELYQCNLDYFQGDFDIGVTLHACGQATDLVLQKCYKKSAAFVCCPCCYGSIQPNHSVGYPRSRVYREAVPELSDYLCLGHTADQTHGPEHPSTAQGQLCMRLVDADRLLHAKEMGYTTKLMLMTPVTCSPKNHILLGVRAR